MHIHCINTIFSAWKIFNPTTVSETNFKTVSFDVIWTHFLRENNSWSWYDRNWFPLVFYFWFHITVMIWLNKVPYPQSFFLSCTDFYFLTCNLEPVVLTSTSIFYYHCYTHKGGGWIISIYILIHIYICIIYGHMYTHIHIYQNLNIRSNFLCLQLTVYI